MISMLEVSSRDFKAEQLKRTKERKNNSDDNSGSYEEYVDEPNSKERKV